MRAVLKLEPDQKQLFVDDLLVAENHGAIRKFWQATKCEENPVTQGQEASQLIYDAAQSKFRLIHAACYGESTDGVRWDWPPMDIVKTLNGQKTNMLFDSAEERAIGCCPLRDEHDPDAGHRYKMIHVGQDWQSRQKYWRVRTSPDGIHWQRQNKFRFTDEGGIHWRQPDSSWLTYDPERRCFVFYCRCYHVPPEVAKQELPPRYLGRAVARTTSTDLVHWSEPELVMHVDQDDPPGTEVYYLTAFPYGSHWLGLWRRHISWPHAGILDLRLAYSADGIEWVRHRDQALIPLGQIGTWDRFNNQAASVPIAVGNELWVFYIGATWRHAEYRSSGLPDTEYKPRTGEYRDLITDRQMRGDWAALTQRDTNGSSKGLWSGLGIAKLRMDGFASIGASFDGGEITTVPMILPQGHLHVNVQSRFGALGVEVLDAGTADVLNGLGSLPITADSIDAPVIWPKAEPLLAVRDRPVRLRFTLRNAQLYTFWVSDGGNKDGHQ